MSTIFDPEKTWGENPFLGFMGLGEELLEQEPRAAYFGQQEQFGRSPRQRQFLQNQFSRYHNQYLGTLGAGIRQGQWPETSFSEYAAAIPFASEYASMPPAMAGRGFTSQFAPRARSLYSF